MLNRRTLLLAGGAALAAPSLAAAQAPAPLAVLASFTILADLVAQVGGERVAVSSLVPPGGDAHVFQPSPADAKRAAEAGMIVINGLGFEGWIDRLVAAAGGKSRLVTAAQFVKPIEAEDEDGHGHGHGKGDGKGHGHALDPHAWQSVANARIYVETIRKALGEIDHGGVELFARNAETYLKQLDALDAEIKAAVAALPPERRVVITTHDAFGYFAAAYGMKFIAPKGVSSDAEASPRAVARIIRQIRTEKIPAVFLENVTDPRQMQRIAQETGARIGGTLYSDSLSPPDGPAPTYIAMMRHNIRELTKALAA